MNAELKTLAAELVAAVLERFVPTAETIVGLPDAARIEIMQAADPVAADRAKRYIWSRIERNDTSRGAGQ